MKTSDIWNNVYKNQFEFLFFGLKLQSSLINSLQKFQIIGKTRKIQKYNNTVYCKCKVASLHLKSWYYFKNISELKSYLDNQCLKI